MSKVEKLNPSDKTEPVTMLISKADRLRIDQLIINAEDHFGVRIRSRGAGVSYGIKLALEKQREMFGNLINKDVESIV
jgi:hypothetical protein